MKHYTVFFKNTLRRKEIYFLFILIGICLRFFFLPVAKADYVTFLEPWVAFIKSHGYEYSLKYPFYDYTPTYIYFLILIAKLGLNPLFAIKFLSFFFEYLAAYFVAKIAHLKYKTHLVFWASIAIVPLLPTVLLNSSYLSQCDIIYTSFILGSLYFLFAKKQLACMVFLSVAFVFKLQTVFILPLFFALMLRREIKWFYFGLIPLFYIVSIVPAWVYGRSLSDLLTIYVMQSGKYKFLALNFPNAYIFIDNKHYELAKLIGVSLVTTVTLLSGFWLRKRVRINFEQLVLLAFLSSILTPFLLPGMHERYMFLGDVLGVLYFMVFRKNIHLPIGILLVSLYSYARCSRFNDLMPMWPAFFVYLFVIVAVIIDFVRALKSESNVAEN